MMREKIQKLVNVYKKYGFIGFCRKLYAYIVANYLDKISFAVLFRPKFYREKVREMLDADCDRVILWRSSFGYNVPLFQRPQHIARNLAKNRCLVIYEVTTMTDRIKTLKKHEDRLYLFNFNNILLRRILMQELEKSDRRKYVQLYSTDWKLSVADIEDYISRGFGFIYEYIDHISPELAGTKDLPRNISEKYDYVMSHDNTYAVVTAKLLMDDVIAHRGEKNLVFSSNGVDYGFFRQFEQYEFEPEFQRILDMKKPIVCYYGALAKWFDYELLKKIAATGKYSVVLFGIKYDDAYDTQFGGCENVYVLGPRDYSVLKYYARCADVLTIPFKINDITRSTSPVKIFEYMALHKPIVTTDMNECRKYKSVLIGHSHEEFLENLDKAMALRDDAEYISLLDAEARNNDWAQKAQAIISLIEKDEK